MARQQICDAPGCTVGVRRGILMCKPHWYLLPRELRAAINAAWRERRMSEWSANCLEARRFIADQGTSATITPAEAYARNQRLLGEREDADA